MTLDNQSNDFPPRGSWDSHVHIFDEDHFPMHPHHAFHPRKASLGSLQAFHRQIGIDHACLVAFSPYHTDNSSLLDALASPNCPDCAVACINPGAVTDQELRTLHEAGVRGVRINLCTRSESFDGKIVIETATRIRPLDWVLQIYLSLDQIVDLAPLVPGLGVRVVLDHIGAPQADRGPAKSQQGYDEFMRLLREGWVWTKLSGIYRFPDLPDLDDYVTTILQVAPDHVVWASDWPHSGGAEANPDGDRDKVQDYREIDDHAWVKQCWRWCRQVEGGQGLLLADKIWRTNPQRLWQVIGDEQPKEKHVQ
ncbi:amidohydrolase 2 [Fusarium beomiforme]|uniref:Amidohydrolase 2 n=1 Tax=Fusarium beomiforme TaxID=44412 RepID=A0A9P5ACN6_9HYPO|nr:amidohydrolase 2 [Fusarium beomiforme]